MIFKLLILSAVVTNIIADVCNSRQYDTGIVCVCNRTYCDNTPKLEALTYGTYQLYTTSKARSGHNVDSGDFSADKTESIIISVGTKKYQTILGFGGAFTDATGINIKSLPEDLQQKLVENYFGPNGNEYSLGRVPIGGVDFSLRPYSYDDTEDDDELSHFALQEEDFTYKIPFIQQALELKGDSPFNLYASAWTAPPWMKNNEVWASGYSILREDKFQVWADYAVKFFDEYEKNGIKFWGMTTGNEPVNGYAYTDINSMGWIPYLEAQWVAENLGPTLANSSHDIKIMVFDENRPYIPYFVPEMFHNDAALKYVDGVAAHWYADTSTPPGLMELTKTDKKDVFLLMSEACYFRQGISPGNWSRGAGYATSILDYLEFGAIGWVDWNMALNLTGGPTYIGYEADSPIIVDPDAEEFFKNPMFYVLGLFSKFIVPDSVRIDVDYTVPEGSNLRSLAFLRPDNLVALVVYNGDSDSAAIQLENGGSYSQSIELEGDSLTTIVFPLEDTN